MGALMASAPPAMSAAKTTANAPLAAQLAKKTLFASGSAGAKTDRAAAPMANAPLAISAAGPNVSAPATGSARSLQLAHQARRCCTWGAWLFWQPRVLQVLPG